MQVRVKICLLINRLCVHVVVVMMLLLVAEFLRAPSLQSTFCLLQCVVAYLSHALIFTYPRIVTSSVLRPLRLFFFALILTLILVSGSNDSTDEILGRLGFCLSAQVIQAFVFPVGAMTLVQSVSYAAAHTWVTGQVFGAVNLWLVIFQLCLQAIICIALPIIFEFAVREWIVASFQSQDSDSMIAGFRQMLKGICDGDLLLDGNFQICGSAPCLQRLLSSSEDFAGHSFRELIVDEEARAMFDLFLGSAAAKGDGEEGTQGGAPRCLRVPLRAFSGQTISVDVFHVPLPPSLCGESTTYHLQLGCVMSDILLLCEVWKC